MKKLICILLCALLVSAAFSGCSKKESPEEETQTSEATTEAVTEPDLDLSQMSGTAIYSEVYNIMSEPQKYVGKIIKIKGNFQIYEDVQQNEGFVQQQKIFYACVIPDATACCQQGIEFVPAKAMNYPSDFPQLGTEIIVSGKFTPYTDNGQQYYTLMNSDFQLA